ncbi:MAG: hypothetical protein HC916_14670 [Coleofasciculaceae cyanobacterium SM2_1_6]|nr:hypothetical protein [Coleofasciculaceae cyanobacterium SM2_1_6]
MVLTFAAIDLTDAEKSKEDKDGALAALIIFGIPSGIIGGATAWNIVRDEKKKEEQVATQESDRLQSIFYLLLRNNNGFITTLLFAMEAKISPEDAKAYLDQKAKEFSASFDVDDQGGIIYQFNLGTKKSF